MKSIAQSKEMYPKKTNNKATLPKTVQLKLNKEDWGVNLLHELQLVNILGKQNFG